MLCLPRNANLSQPERRYGPRRRHSEGGEFGRRAGEFQRRRRATDSPMHGEQEAG